MSQESPSIDSRKEWSLSMDFSRLRKEAIAFTQQASGDRWTDYNFHDPGVTILEQFCYALTDVAYRTNLDIETILFHGGKTQATRESHALFGPSEILAPGPITTEDYRILLLDGFPNVIRNCWVEKIGDHGEGIRGLYQVTILLHGHVDSGQHAAVREQIRKYFIRFRNLGEDLERIVILDPVEVCISADIDLFQDVPGEEILAEILFQVEQYFNPMVRFRSLAELEKEGKPMEEIFDVPSHQHGFIERSKLEPKQQQYYVSRVGDCITAVRGVKMIRNLTVTVGGMPVFGDLVDVAARNYLTLGFTGQHFTGSFFGKSRINLFKGGALTSFSEQSVINLLEIRLARTHRNYPIRSEFGSAIVQPIGTEDLVSYESVQKSFPGVYGVGDFSPALEEGPLRVAQSSQLKAYLLMFDQIMANHLAQLAGIAEMFSIDVPEDEDVLKTYFARPVSASGADELLFHTLAPRSEITARIKALENSDAKNTAAIRLELAALRSDLAERGNRVENRIAEFLTELRDSTLTRLKRSTYKDHNELMAAAVELVQSFPAGKRPALIGKDARQLTDVQQQLVRTISELLREELQEKPLECSFRQEHLDRLMHRHDRSSERKNRILSHYLARFGQRFNSDFQHQFSAWHGDENEEESSRQLLRLKSLFLKEIRTLSRYRGQGLDYLADEQLDIPARRRIALKLDLRHDAGQRLMTSAAPSGIRSAPISKKEIARDKRGDGQDFLHSGSDSGKVRFLINSPDYQSYLFRFGTDRRNYSLVSESGKSVVYFASSNRETPTRLVVCENRKEAESKIKVLIRTLKDINSRQEGFHIVDHILLRPVDMDVCKFRIYGPEKNILFTSKEARPREAQRQHAFDTALLGCYSTNYKVLRTTKKEYVVVVKNAIGKEMASASVAFLTELAAQEFIDSNVQFFNQNREADTLHTLYDLDDETKVRFCLVDARQDVLLQAMEPSGQADQEEKAGKAVNVGLYPDRYRVEELRENSFAVFLMDSEGVDLARSRKEFTTEDLALDFIRTTVRHLDQSRDLKSLIQYRRINGRNFAEFNAQISVVYPNWTTRFSNRDFFQMFLGALHEAMPAHLAVHVIGLSASEMRSFEDVYFKYLEELRILSIENRDTVSKLSGEVLDLLSTKIKTL